jgi:hypothetical protein
MLFNFQKLLHFEYLTTHSRELTRNFLFFIFFTWVVPHKTKVQLRSTGTSRKSKSSLIPKILKEKHRVHDPLQSPYEKLVQFCLLSLQFNKTMRDLENYQVGTVVSRSIMQIKVTNQPRRENLRRMQEWMLKQQKKEEWKDRVGERGTYREVFSDVWDLLLGFLGNPKAPNFCQSFLHLLLPSHPHSPSSLLSPHFSLPSSQSHTEKRRTTRSSFNKNLSLSLSHTHTHTTKRT